MLPTGMVTFLFTDIEGSTARWEDAPDEMIDAVSRHNAIMRDGIDAYGGVLFETAGDSFVVAFDAAGPAIEMAVWVQQALHNEPWPAATGPLQVRMAVHTGAAQMRPDGYYAQHTLSRQARLLSIGHGGQILVSEATWDLAGQLADGLRLRDMGKLWLKDLIKPEQVFQVVASSPAWSLPSEFPPLRSRRPPPGNLPAAAFPFVGREKTLDDVTRAVTHGPSRLLTLLGPGGIGKTRLALRVAERVQHRFVDGVFFVDLAPVTDPELVLPTIANAVGADGDSNGGASLESWFRERELLLVLDNLEQVIDAATDVARLLSQAPDLRILATSRIPLQILAEAEFPLASLDVPEVGDDTTLSAMARTDAVALFVARSAASMPGFALTDDNKSDVAAICRRLEGIPLALVLAGARSKILEPAAMLERLEHRLTLLTDGARDLPTRHQTLRDTVEWSYDLLDDSEKSLYACLSIHAGGFRSDDAIAVNPDRRPSDVLKGIELLVQSSLLQAMGRIDGVPRYRMLETIAEHAQEKLAAVGATAEAEVRHARHYLGVAEEAASHFEGERHVEWVGRLDEEHDNLRAILSRAEPRCETGDLQAIAMTTRLAAALGTFWIDRGHLQEGQRHLERAVDVAPRWIEAVDASERPNAQRSFAEISEFLGLVARRRGDLVAGQRHTKEAVEIYGVLGDDLARAKALISLGTMSFHGGEPDKAREIYNLGLEVARSVPENREAVAGALLSLGNLERDAGNHEHARSLYERALAIDIEVHSLVDQSVSLNNLANLAVDTGDFERAQSLHLRSLDLRQRTGARMMLAESMVGIALVAIASGQFVRAARLIGFAEGVAEVLGAEFDPMERRLHRRAVDALVAELGQSAVAEELRHGQLMNESAAVEYARQSSHGESPVSGP